MVGKYLRNIGYSLFFLAGFVIGCASFFLLWYAEPTPPYHFIYEGF